MTVSQLTSLRYILVVLIRNITHTQNEERLMKSRIQAAILTSFVLFTGVSHAQESSQPYLTGYWQNFNNPAETPVRLTDIPAGYNVVTIAFADMASDGSISFTLQGPPYTSMQDAENVFKNDIKILQSKGVKVLLSLGGQNGYYTINDATQKTRFIRTAEELIATYGFDGLDYDLESGLSTANVTFLVDATRTIKNDFAAKGKTLFFSMAPETIDVYWQVFPYGKYDELIKSNLMNVIHVQLYNSGCMPGIKPGSACYTQGTEDFIVSQADSTIQTWLKNGIKEAEKLYAIGLPATSSAANGGYVKPDTLKKAMQCLQTQTNCDTYIPVQAYPNLKNTMTWSINWDAKNGYEFEKTVAGKK